MAQRSINTSSFVGILGILISLVLSGCGNGSQEELKEYVDKIKSRPGGPIEPLPEVKPYEQFIYLSEDKRDPFLLPPPPKEVVTLPLDNGIRPDVERRREALEAFPLDSLRMVGTVNKDNEMWAIILDSEGAVHRIKAGNYIGRHYGRVDKVLEGKMDITEIVSDGQGAWQERKASMALIE